LDYTIIKLNGDKFNANNANSKPFTTAPGDVLDDPTSIETAITAIVQAIAYQPATRNATLSVSGILDNPLPQTQDNDDNESWYSYGQEQFLCLDGPEIWRSVLWNAAGEGDDPLLQEYYNQAVEYVKEWGDLLASTGKGLTTPVRSEHGITYKFPPRKTILTQDGV
jgi:hypothetical protein